MLVADYFWKLWVCLSIPNHTQLNKYNDQIVPCIKIINIITLLLILEIFSRDISNSLFQCTLGMPRHIWPHHQKITWSNCNLYSWLLQNHKGNYGASFKFKNAHIDGPNLIMPEHAWPHPIKITWSNKSLHGHLITCKKWPLCLK